MLGTFSGEGVGAMRGRIAAVLLAASGGAPGQALLDLPGPGLAFGAEVVEAFAERAYQQRLSALRADGRLDATPTLRARLQRLLERLVRAADRERPGIARLPWEIHTCRRCGEGASAAAGGGLLVGEEFLLGLRLADDEVAYLVAHEVAHVLAEHTREFAHAARYFVDNGLRREYWDIQRELDASLPAQYRMAFIAEQQELEADRIALFLGAGAGYHPSAMASLVEKLAGASRGAGPATHPPAERRAAQVAKGLGAAALVWSRALEELAADRAPRGFGGSRNCHNTGIKCLRAPP